MFDRMPGAPRSRTFVHPGPFGAVRIETLSAGEGRHFRLSLAAGRSLHDGIVDALASVDVWNASMTLIGGSFESMSFCLARTDITKRVVAAYTEPLLICRARFIFGNATLGKSPTGAPAVHCHAVFRREDGMVHGGHLLAERCIVGVHPVMVVATSLDDFELRIGYDEETRMPLMRPRPEAPHA